jgi:hypothetical protein
MAASLGGHSGERHIVLGSDTFTAEVIFDPHKLRPSAQRELAQRFGGRVKDGAVCLGIDKAAALESVKGQDYSAVAFIRNDVAADEASGTLQWYPWCATTSEPQLWIGDLCRITEGAKPKRSPIEALLLIFEDIARAAGISEMYLMVENKAPERNVLPGVYRRYGFEKVDTCIVDGDDSIIMRRPVKT